MVYKFSGVESSAQTRGLLCMQHRPSSAINIPNDSTTNTQTHNRHTTHMYLLCHLSIVAQLPVCCVDRHPQCCECGQEVAGDNQQHRPQQGTRKGLAGGVYLT